ncbi:MAG: hypothetical protein ACK5PJ_05280 [Ralstonia sp.]
MEEIVRHALRTELESVGLFSHKPEERQSLQQDFAFVRAMRSAYTGAAATAGKAVMGVIVVGILGLIVAGAKIGLWPAGK